MGYGNISLLYYFGSFIKNKTQTSSLYNMGFHTPQKRHYPSRLYANSAVSTELESKKPSSLSLITS